MAILPIYVTLFDGVCDQTKKIQTLYNFMSINVKWIISSSGNYMFVRFDTQLGNWMIARTGFSANIHYGK